MGKQLSTYNGIWLRDVKKQTTDTNEMDKSQKHYVKWEKATQKTT